MIRLNASIIDRKFAFLAVMVASCGVSNATLRVASNAEYRVPRDVLWSKILFAVRSRYPKMEVAELDATRLVTRWIETKHRVRGLVPFRGGTTQGQPYVPFLQRVTVVVSGANPYRIAVDVEAAISLNQESPEAFPHGDFSEPLWVSEEKDAVVSAIHDRLKPYVNAL